MDTLNRQTKKAHKYTKKDTLQRLEADLYAQQAIQRWLLFRKYNSNFKKR